MEYYFHRIHSVLSDSSRSNSVQSDYNTALKDKMNKNGKFVSPKPILKGGLPIAVIIKYFCSSFSCYN